MKRRTIPIYEHDVLTQSIRDKIASWKLLHKDQRTLYHYAGNVTHSLKRDIEQEAKEMLRRFHAGLLPTYEPEYIWVSKDPLQGLSRRNIQITNQGFREVSNLEEFFADTFNAFKKRQELNFDIGDRKTVSGIRVGLNVYNFITDDGSIITYDDESKSITREILSENKKAIIESKTFYNTRYLFIPGAITLIDVIDINGNSIEREIVEVLENGKYESLFDLNGNGIVDEDDLAVFESAEGINYKNVSEDDWNNIYTRLDINHDGAITRSEIETAKQYLMTSSQDGTLIKIRSKLPAATVTYSLKPQVEPRDIYIKDGNVKIIQMNTLGSIILEKQILDVPGRKALVEPRTANFLVEIDQNDSVNFVRIDNLRTFKNKFSYADIDVFKPIKLTIIDDILLLLTRSSNDLSYRLYPVDLRNEAIEYSENYIDINTEGRTIKWLTTSESDNRFYLCLENNDGTETIVEYDFIKKYFFIDETAALIYGTEPLNVNFYDQGQIVGSLTNEGRTHTPVSTLEFVPRKVQNSIDDFAYNWGDYRIPAETNDEFKNRILDYWIHLQGSNKTGMLYGIAKLLGVRPSELDRYKPTESTRIAIGDSWFTSKPMYFLSIDSINQTLELFTFKEYIDESEDFIKKITLSGLYRPTSEGIEIPEQFATFKRDFSLVSYADVITKTPVGNTGSWDIEGEEIGDGTDVVVYNNGVIDFTKSPFLLQQFSGKSLIVYFDALDSAGNIHKTNYEIVQFPHYQTPTDLSNAAIKISNLLFDGTYRSRKLGTEEDRNILIGEIRAIDNSRWNNTIIDDAFYNTASISGEKLKPTIWSGLSFNKHFERGDYEWEK